MATCYSYFTVYRTGSWKNFDGFRIFLKEKIANGNYKPTDVLCNLEEPSSTLPFYNEHYSGDDFYDEILSIVDEYRKVLAPNCTDEAELEELFSIFIVLEQQTNTSGDGIYRCGYKFFNEEDYFDFSYDSDDEDYIDKWDEFKETKMNDDIMYIYKDNLMSDYDESSLDDDDDSGDDDEGTETPAPSGKSPTQPSDRTCSACGHALKPTSKFCPGCGVKQAVVCGNCGKVPREGAKFCAGCGKKL